MRKRNISIIILVIFLIISAILLFQEKEAKKTAVLRISELVGERDDYRIKLEETSEKLVEKSREADALSIELEEERAIWFQERNTLEEEQLFLTNRIDSLNEEKNRLTLVIGDHSPGLVEELIRKRNEIEAQIMAEQERSQSLTATIGLMEIEIKNNEGYVQNITQTLLDVYDVLLNLNSEVDFIDDYQINPGNEDIPILDNINQNLSILQEQVYATREKLAFAEEAIANYENSESSFFDLENTNNTFKEKIQKTIAELENREARLAAAEKKINTRYLLYATTDELIDMGLLHKQKGGGLFRSKKIKYTDDLSKIKKEYCVAISKNSKNLAIPYSISNLNQILSPHSDFSYTIRPSNYEPSRTEILISDVEEFWKTTFFLVIEIKN